MLKTIKNWWHNESLSAPQEEIVVPLKELSNIWLKYNNSYQKAQTPSVVVTVESMGTPPAASPNTSPSETPPLPDVLTGGPDKPELPKIGATGAPTPFDKNSDWSNEATEFIRNAVKPYENMCKHVNTLDGIYQIIKILDDQGGCPSIVQVGTDKADNDINSVKAALSQVTLRAHSFKVAMFGIELIKSSWHESVIPSMIVAALGHDLGKLPSLRVGDTYSKHDHPIISAEKVASIFEGQMPKGIDIVLQAIKDHHQGKSSEQFTACLQSADGKARETEIAAVYGLQMKEWRDWFDPKEFLKLLKPQINAPQTGKAWKAFSYGGNVYFDKMFLQETAREYAKLQKIADLSVIRDRDIEYALKKIVTSLREIEAVSSELPNKEDFVRLYEILTTQGYPQSKLLVPLKIEAFGMPSELERNKDGSFYSIKSVKPKEGGRKG
ncbi:MAG: HD domain-containing protein [Syntrophales bacterium]|jgi:hypothetical protein|nr:HD domain-containing protein [Syntrophales bacterium]